jgi:hypothetical protein
VPVPLTPVPSIGSAMHGHGCCKPCGFFWKSGGCRFGSDCQHCHLCPPREQKFRQRLVKQQIMRL